MILAVDPGDTTGWAILSMQGILADMGQVKLDKLHDFLDSLVDIDTIVIENFRVRPGVNFSWSELATIQVIGAFGYKAHLLKAKFVKQEPANYTIGAKWAGITIPKNHDISHQVVAYSHGTYYSHKVLKNVIPVARRQGNG